MQEIAKIYRRTPRGNAELEARRSSLGAALNSLLVLVNGERTQQELMTFVARHGGPDNSLQMLESDGYIELVNTATNSAASRQFESATESAENAALAVPAGQAFASPQKRYSDTERRALLYKYLIGAVKKHLGLKGFFYHLKVEKAVTLAELLELVEPVGNAIAKAQGLVAANHFMAQGRQLARE